MSVPKGYKETKVGIVPEDWKETPLSSFIHEKIVYCNDEKVNLGSLTIENGVIPKPAQYKREHLVKDTTDAYKLVEYSDFAYNPMNLRFGALALYLRQEQLKVSSYYNIFNIDKNIVDIDYIYAYLKSERIMFHYNRMATGSLEEKKRVHFKEFKKFIFPLPPLKEQQKIAQILTTWDDAISKQEALIKSKEELKKGLMQKLLSGEIRFDGFDGEWEKVKFENIATFYSGGTPIKTNKEYYNGNIPFIGSGNIEDTHVHKFITHDALMNSSAKLVNKGDLLYALYGANSGEVALSQINGAINQAILCIRSKENLYFLYQYLLLKKDKIVSTFLQGGQGNLSAKIIKNLKVPLPTIKEQQKIVQLLKRADKEIDLLKNELETLKDQKLGLMQRLLSGEVRVSKMIKGKLI